VRISVAGEERVVPADTVVICLARSRCATFTISRVPGASRPNAEGEFHGQAPGTGRGSNLAGGGRQTSVDFWEGVLGMPLLGGGYPNSGEVDRGFMDASYFRAPLGQLPALACHPPAPPTPTCCARLM
jgi:hypothetical protein